MNGSRVFICPLRSNKLSLDEACCPLVTMVRKYLPYSWDSFPCRVEVVALVGKIAGVLKEEEELVHSSNSSNVCCFDYYGALGRGRYRLSFLSCARYFPGAAAYTFMPALNCSPWFDGDPFTYGLSYSSHTFTSTARSTKHPSSTPETKEQASRAHRRVYSKRGHQVVSCA